MLAGSKNPCSLVMTERVFYLFYLDILGRAFLEKETISVGGNG